MEEVCEAAPRIVCLCGSTRFRDEFQAVTKRLGLEGKIVLTVVFFSHLEGGFALPGDELITHNLHLKKIGMADEVHIINRDGYIGNTTRDEIAYAHSLGKPVTYEFPRFNPIPMILFCPRCHRQHLDVGPWEVRLHRTHLCENTPAGLSTGCGHEWRPSHVSTKGVLDLGPKP